MKIITWNCNMAFRDKAQYILALSPDILVVPECEHPDKIIFPSNFKQPTDKLWFGKNQHKGLGVFSFCDFRIKVLDVHNENFRMIVPIAVTGGQFDFNLFAVWANNPADPDGHYVTQTWKAINHYDNLLSNKPAILIGDFNSNTIWDKKHPRSDHSDVVKFLEEKDIHSTYHKHHKQIQGKEKHPTQYMYRHKDKPYHLDYCFMSSVFCNKLLSVEIGKYKKWAIYSDHTPLIVEFGI